MNNMATQIEDKIKLDYIVFFLKCIMQLAAK